MINKIDCSILIKMNEYEYLAKSNDNEVLNTWAALGSIWVTSSTRAYIKDSVVIVNEPGVPLNQRVIYILDSHLGAVDWSTINNEKSDLCVSGGIMLPWFRALKTKFDGSFTEDTKFVPYSGMKNDTGGVIIPESDFEMIMTCIGFPAVQWEDTEVGPNAVKRDYIKPALMKYWNFRPRIVDEGVGQIGPNVEFKIEAPEGCYDAMPFFSTGPDVNAGDFASWQTIDARRRFRNTPGLAIRGVTTGRFGKGYDAMDTVSSRFDPEMVSQGDINHFRREYLDVVTEDGKVYVKGYSTTGGKLNIQWCWASFNWNDIPFRDKMTLAMPLCQINICQNISIIRSLVKSDIPGALDIAEIKAYGASLKADLDKIIQDPAFTNAAGISR